MKKHFLLFLILLPILLPAQDTIQKNEHFIHYALQQPTKKEQVYVAKDSVYFYALDISIVRIRTYYPKTTIKKTTVYHYDGLWKYLYSATDIVPLTFKEFSTFSVVYEDSIFTNKKTYLRHEIKP